MLQIAPAQVPKLEVPIIDPSSRPEEQPQEVTAHLQNTRNDTQHQTLSHMHDLTCTQRNKG